MLSVETEESVNRREAGVGPQLRQLWVHLRMDGGSVQCHAQGRTAFHTLQTPLKLSSGSSELGPLLL